MADIVPIFKGKGSKYDVNNYRPISLTSTVYKLMESVIHYNISDHCNLKNILTPEQHGFRNNHSTTSVLLELLNDITKIIDDGNSVDVITLDFAKAFDSISHNKLIYKLQFYGICGKVQSWIKEFLNNRLFRVKLNYYKSNCYPVTSSVPKGTKLAPILYNLYCNDIVNNFKYAKVKMYAVDLTIYAIIKNDDDRIKLQNELNDLVNWTAKWQLKINYQKYHIIHFGYKNLNFNDCFDNNNITTSHCEKILGVIIDNKLSFKEHIYDCVNRASKICNIIFANIKQVNNSILIKLYKSFARPLLENASVICCPHHINLIELIENVQRRFTKRLPGLYDINYVDRLKSCNTELLDLRRIHTDLIMLYKILNGLIYENMDNCLTLSMSNNRGNVCKLVKQYSRLDTRKYFFALRVIDIWNSLSDDIICCVNVKNFTCILKATDLSHFLKGHSRHEE